MPHRSPFYWFLLVKMVRRKHAGISLPFLIFHRGDTLVRWNLESIKRRAPLANLFEVRLPEAVMCESGSRLQLDPGFDFFITRNLKKVKKNNMLRSCFLDCINDFKLQDKPPVHQYRMNIQLFNVLNFFFLLCHFGLH